MAEHGMADRRLAKLAGHRDMLRMIKVLASEEHDLPMRSMRSAAGGSIESARHRLSKSATS
jgi:hypothetical protein